MGEKHFLGGELNLTIANHRPRISKSHPHQARGIYPVPKRPRCSSPKLTIALTRPIFLIIQGGCTDILTKRILPHRERRLAFLEYI